MSAVSADTIKIVDAIVDMIMYHTSISTNQATRENFKSPVVLGVNHHTSFHTHTPPPTHTHTILVTYPGVHNFKGDVLRGSAWGCG